MANKQITLKITRTYPNQDGTPVTSNSVKVIDYAGQNEGVIDVPAGTPAGAFAIPFGGIASATYVEVENGTDSEAQLKINGSAALHSVAPGGLCILTQPEIPAGTDLTGISLTTEAATVAAGEIKYRVLGDPV